VRRCCGNASTSPFSRTISSTKIAAARCCRWVSTVLPTITTPGPAPIAAYLHGRGLATRSPRWLPSRSPRRPPSRALLCRQSTINGFAQRPLICRFRQRSRRRLRLVRCRDDRQALREAGCAHYRSAVAPLTAGCQLQRLRYRHVTKRELRPFRETLRNEDCGLRNGRRGLPAAARPGRTAQLFRAAREAHADQAHDHRAALVNGGLMRCGVSYRRAAGGVL